MRRRLFERKVVCVIAIVMCGCVGAPGMCSAQSAPTPPTVQDGVPPAKVSAPTLTPQGTSAVVMDLSAIESVIGKSVKSVGGEDLGRIVDLLVTTSGQVRAAVIDFGGVLGVGSRKVAVDWKALDFANVTKDGTVRLALTRNEVRVSPQYKSGEPVVILQASRPEEPKASSPDQKSAPVSEAATPSNSAPQGEAHKR